MADATDRDVTREDLEKELVLEREHWIKGPPHELFKEMRGKCPVHWTSKVTEIPAAAGFWSVTTADDVYTVSRDWQTYSSELGGVVVIDEVFPIEMARAMFIGMDPPKHDRLKALFQAGLHAEADRRPRGRDPPDRPSTCSTGSRGARAATWSPTSPSPRSRG